LVCVFAGYFGPNFCRSPFARGQTWVGFFLEGVEQTANSAEQTARRLVDFFKPDTKRTEEIGRTVPNALRVLAALRQRPVLGLPQLCQHTGMTFPTASKGMDKFAGSGIVRELTGKRRNRVFVYGAYLDILSGGGEPL
jgi:Fic family protein